MKNNTYVIISAVVLLIAIAGGYFFTQSEHLGMKHSKSERMEDMQKDEAAHNGHGDSPVNGISERAFIEHMIPHHQEAVDTARQVVARGENAEVKALAEAIIVAQEKEISDMKTWYQNWYGTEYKDVGSHEPMMRDLAPLSGNELDRAFIEDMIPHHTHALVMNQQVIPNIEHDEIKSLATAIAETQSAEIVTMRILLKSL